MNVALPGGLTPPGGREGLQKGRFWGKFRCIRLPASSLQPHFPGSSEVLSPFHFILGILHCSSVPTQPGPRVFSPLPPPRVPLPYRNPSPCHPGLLTALPALPLHRLRGAQCTYIQHGLGQSALRSLLPCQPIRGSNLIITSVPAVCAPGRAPDPMLSHEPQNTVPSMMLSPSPYLSLVRHRQRRQAQNHEPDPSSGHPHNSWKPSSWERETTLPS